ncbi:MAG TPA: hypothetical protein VNK67_05285 [Burkholderiales bacterium]|nr:hypothetical protein [Burkholderiales bacterium]
MQREVVVDAILKSPAASPVLGYREPFILRRQHARGAPLADVTPQQKDMTLVLEQARRCRAPPARPR